MIVGILHVARGHAFFSELPAASTSLPGLAAVLLLGGRALWMRERSWRLVLAGVLAAATATVLGWVLALLFIVVVSWAIIAVLAEVM
jgi:hypothetical protein